MLLFAGCAGHACSGAEPVTAEAVQVAEPQEAEADHKHESQQADLAPTLSSQHEAFAFPKMRVRDSITSQSTDLCSVTVASTLADHEEYITRSTSFQGMPVALSRSVSEATGARNRKGLGGQPCLKEERLVESRPSACSSDDEPRTRSKSKQRPDHVMDVPGHQPRKKKGKCRYKGWEHYDEEEDEQPADPVPSCAQMAPMQSPAELHPKPGSKEPPQASPRRGVLGFLNRSISEAAGASRQGASRHRQIRSSSKESRDTAQSDAESGSDMSSVSPPRRPPRRQWFAGPQRGGAVQRSKSEAAEARTTRMTASNPLGRMASVDSSGVDSGSEDEDDFVACLPDIQQPSMSKGAVHNSGFLTRSLSEATGAKRKSMQQQQQQQDGYGGLPAGMPFCTLQHHSEGDEDESTTESAPASVDKSPLIKTMSETEFVAQYKLGGHVMHSCHHGMFVMFATRRSDDLNVVVKIRSKALSFNGCKRKELEWCKTMEAVMRMPKSDVICDFMEVIETDRRYYVVMELVEGQDLWNWEASQVYFEHAAAREIMRQLLQSVQLIHGQGRVHKDLKMENVMADVREEGKVRVKLIDFDTVDSWHEDGPKATNVVGSDRYIAPEMYKGACSPKSDMYSIGVIMYKLLTRRYPVSPTLFHNPSGDNRVGSQSMRRIHRRLKQAHIDFLRSPLDACPDAAALCRALLSLDPAARPSAEEALQFEWFKQEGPLPEWQPEPERRSGRMNSKLSSMSASLSQLSGFASFRRSSC